MDTNLKEKVTLHNDITTFAEFETWRNDNVDHVSKFYNLSNKTEPFKKKIIPKNLMFFFKCVKQFTRQVCQCDDQCYDSSIKSINLHDDYFDLKLDNSNDSSKENVCSYFGLTIIDGKFYGAEGNLPYFDTRIKLIDSLRGICDEKYFYFTDLQCVNYEIKEACQNYNKCSEEFVFTNLPLNCKSEDTKVQINMIENLLGISIFDRLEELNKNTRHIKRSVDNLPYDIVYNSTEDSKSNDILESSNFNILSKTSMISNTIVFSLLFATVGYFTFNLIKKRCTRIKIYPKNNNYECQL